MTTVISTITHSPGADAAAATCAIPPSLIPKVNGSEHAALHTARQEGVLRNLRHMQGALEAIEGQYKRIARPVRVHLSALDQIVGLIVGNPKLVYDGPYDKEIATLVILRKLCEHAKS